MKRTLLSCSTVVLLALIVGCTSTSPRPSSSPGTPPKAKRAYVLVDGRLYATTPATVTIRRENISTRVALYANLREDHPPAARVFEIERVENLRTSDRSELDFSFSADFTDGMRTYNVQDLPTKNDTNFVVPYYRNPVQIEDHEYDLTLIVKNY